MNVMDVVFEPFGGEYVLDNSLRLVIVFVGFTLGLVVLKLGWGFRKSGETDRMWGAIAFALIVVAPAMHAVSRVGQPLIWPANLTYLSGLVAAIVALWHRITISPPWLGWHRNRRAARRAHRAHRKAARRDQRQRIRVTGKALS